MAYQRKKPKPKAEFTFDQKDKIRLQVNSKTWIYVNPDITQKEIEEIKQRYAPKY